ncbi:unnamed protein product [Echinostoma caproni]|uniref:Polyprotein n=1 Tax=Echinostoma caproni TaxID=27848 RepID=A0A183AH67_9TREM|nr:unnamed protein product [Echinostoma caproni]
MFAFVPSKPRFELPVAPYCDSDDLSEESSDAEQNEDTGLVEDVSQTYDTLSPDTKRHGELYPWLNAKPIRDVPPVPPLAGQDFPESGGDLIEFPVIRDLVPTYACYTCKHCETVQKEEILIEDECTECARARPSVNPLYRTIEELQTRVALEAAHICFAEP